MIKCPKETKTKETAQSAIVETTVTEGKLILNKSSMISLKKLRKINDTNSWTDHINLDFHGTMKPLERLE